MTPPNPSKQRNVLLALGWYDHRLLQGISAYAAKHHWHLAASSITHEHVIPVGWKGAGVLAWLAAGDDLADFVVSLKKPTVDMSLRRSHLKFPRVIQNHDKTGQLVADHFLSRGYQSFVYYSNTDNWSNEGRGQGFEKALRANGRICTWLRWHESHENTRDSGQWASRRNWLAKHLMQLPKPVAVFAANGSLAIEVSEICEQVSLAVPTEVSVVGTADYLLSVSAGYHEISTVDTNLEEQGYQAAALLDRMMNGEAPPAAPILIDPARVVVRKSSDLMAVAHARVSKGLQFIAERFATDISVEDVAKSAGMSRRGLHQAFIDHTGRTPGDQIRVTRIECAKKLLVETNEKIESVASLSGYPNNNTFFIAFRKALKQTPAEFRNAARRGQKPVG